MEWQEIVLLILSIATGLVAIATFTDRRKKESKTEGAEQSALRSDLLYIKDLLLDVRTETKENNKLLDSHSQRLARCEEQLSSGFKRIKRLEDHIDTTMKGE